MKERIGDICTLKSGTTLKEELLIEDGTIPYVKVSDMNLIGNEKYIVTANSYAVSNINEKMLFPIGTVLFPKRGGAIGTNKKRIASRTVCADLNTMGVIPSERIRPLFLYYYFRNIDFGALYNGSSVPQINNSDIAPMEIELPPLEEQDIAVAQLEKVDCIIQKRVEELTKLDDLIKARFVEMFFDKGYPVLGWNDVFNTTTGKLDSNAMVENGDYPFFTCAKEVFRIDKYAFDQEALLLAGNNAAGKYDVKYYKGKFNAYQRTYVLGLKQDWSYRLFQYQLEDKLIYLQQQSLGGLTKYLTMKILESLTFIIPPMEQQIKFEKFVAQVDKSKIAIQKSLAEEQLLFDSLMQGYFG